MSRGNLGESGAKKYVFEHPFYFLELCGWSCSVIHTPRTFCNVHTKFPNVAQAAVAKYNGSLDYVYLMANYANISAGIERRKKKTEKRGPPDHRCRHLEI